MLEWANANRLVGIGYHPHRVGVEQHSGKLTSKNRARGAGLGLPAASPAGSCLVQQGRRASTAHEDQGDDKPAWQLAHSTITTESATAVERCGSSIRIPKIGDDRRQLGRRQSESDGPDDRRGYRRQQRGKCGDKWPALTLA